MQTVKNPPPRMLTANESLHSLNHWKTAFRTYYRRDAYFKAFLQPTATWTNSAITHYGQTAVMEFLCEYSDETSLVTKYNKQA